MNKNYCYLNGKIIPLDKASINICDIGLLRGFSVFDFLKCYNGKPFLLQDHLSILNNSAKEIELTCIDFIEKLISILPLLSRFIRILFKNILLIDLNYFLSINFLFDSLICYPLSKPETLNLIFNNLIIFDISLYFRKNYNNSNNIKNYIIKFINKCSTINEELTIEELTFEKGISHFDSISYFSFKDLHILTKCIKYFQIHSNIQYNEKILNYIFTFDKFPDLLKIETLKYLKITHYEKHKSVNEWHKSLSQIGRAHV